MNGLEAVTYMTWSEPTSRALAQLQAEAQERGLTVTQMVAMSAKRLSNVQRLELWGIGASNVAETPRSHPAESKAVAGEKE